MDQAAIDTIAQQVVQQMTPVITALVGSKLDHILEILHGTTRFQQPAISSHGPEQGPSASFSTWPKSSVQHPVRAQQADVGKIALAASALTGSCPTVPVQEKYIPTSAEADVECQLNSFSNAECGFESLKLPANIIAQSQSGTGMTADMVPNIQSRVGASKNDLQVTAVQSKSPSTSAGARPAQANVEALDSATAPTRGAEGGPTGAALEESKVSKEEESLLRKLIHSKLVSTNADLEMLQKDPNSPLYSVKTFEALNLKPELLKGVYDMGFNAPSKIQETALPALLGDPPANMIAQSQSGTGKTAVCVLTMLSRVDPSKNYPQCLCLAPTYELALQSGEITKKMAKYMTNVRIGFSVRGVRIPHGQKCIDHILIGTPENVSDWCLKFKSVDLKKIVVFVLDEADVMIATQGYQVQSIRIKRMLSPSCQMLLFSATYDEDVMKFAQAIIPNNPIIIKLRRDEESLDNIKQYYIECRDIDDKYQALSNLYATISKGQSMIFCATSKTAHWLAEKMTQERHAVALLSGDLEITQRAAIINRFRDGKEKVLITTNITARGIDVTQVTVVVNFDLPITMEGKPDCETYLHRIGRTGRFGKTGLAINMVDNKRSYSTLKAIEQHFGKTIEKLDAEDVDAI